MSTEASLEITLKPNDGTVALLSQLLNQTVNCFEKEHGKVLDWNSEIPLRVFPDRESFVWEQRTFLLDEAKAYCEKTARERGVVGVPMDYANDTEAIVDSVSPLWLEVDFAKLKIRVALSVLSKFYTDVQQLAPIALQVFEKMPNEIRGIDRNSIQLVKLEIR